MKLNNDKIVIESRSDIDLIQEMISLLLEKGQIKEREKKEIERLDEQLEALYISW